MQDEAIQEVKPELEQELGQSAPGEPLGEASQQAKPAEEVKPIQVEKSRSLSEIFEHYGVSEADKEIIMSLLK